MYLMSHGKKNMIDFATWWPSMRYTPVKKEKRWKAKYCSSVSLCAIGAQFTCQVVDASHLWKSNPSSLSPRLKDHHFWSSFFPAAERSSFLTLPLHMLESWFIPSKCLDLKAFSWYSFISLNTWKLLGYLKKFLLSLASRWVSSSVASFLPLSYLLTGYSFHPPWRQTPSKVFTFSFIHSFIPQMFSLLDTLLAAGETEMGENNSQNLCSHRVYAVLKRDRW